MTKLTILLLYILAAGLLTSLLMRETSRAEKLSASAGLLAATLALTGHSILLVRAMLGEQGLTLELGNIVGLVGWQIGLFALIAAFWTSMRGLSALCMPIAAASILLVGHSAAGPSPNSSGWQIESHIVLSILSYGLFSIAALLALVMVFKERSLRNRHPGLLARLIPSLEAIEQGLFVCIGLGFSLLSLAIFSGLIFLEDMFAQHLVHKTVLSVLAWLLYGSLIFGRWKFGWRGKTAVAWTLGGFAALLLAYFGSRVVMEVFLGRQWG